MNLEEIKAKADPLHWYHTLELTPEYTTNGVFDLRDQVHHYQLPERMDGMRVLDIGTWDGFWAFEMERRGAAEIHGLDIDDMSTLDYPPRRRPKEFKRTEPRGTGFRLAAELKGSKAERVVCNVYDAKPENLGQYDIVFAGSILIHVRDQLLALERIANLVKPGGLFISAEEYDRAASLVPFEVSRYRANRESAVVFWLPSIRTWKSMLWTAGFDDVQQKGRFTLKSARDYSVRHVLFHARKS